MKAAKRFTAHHSLSESIIGFAQYARSQGLKVGIGESKEALKAAEYGMIFHKDRFRFALKALFCSSKEEGNQFDQLFDQYWGKEKGAIRSRMEFHNQSNLLKKGKSSLVMMGRGKSEEAKEESKNISGANAVERLTTTDFSKVSEVESQWLEELAEKLWKQMSLRLKRRLKKASYKGQIDLRKTIRRNISAGGIPVQLMHRQQIPRKQRLIVLLDVSGSMDKYSFFLLRFICALKAHFEKIEAFLFSTRLIRISDYLNAENLAHTLKALSAKANNWSGGTQIGNCLRMFNEQYARIALAGHSTTLILSDGLDTGEPGLLADELHKIHLRTNRLIWLNPLKGMERYQPIQRGMKAALPEIDLFRSAHNLQSLLELEKYLIHV